jgi:hypothetical protein
MMIGKEILTRGLDAQFIHVITMVILADQSLPGNQIKSLGRHSSLYYVYPMETIIIVIVESQFVYDHMITHMA